MWRQLTESRVKPPWSASTSVTATGGEKDRDVQASVDAASQLRVAKVPLGQSAAHGLL